MFILENYFIKFVSVINTTIYEEQDLISFSRMYCIRVLRKKLKTVLKSLRPYIQFVKA